ncbi:hypothetical protein QAD02_008841 [Eretmocerus hayati]|uniref:Uncharacterized protein n=1 Tax=Eretmocerus hayati TaxID=131215 RepID=A0ACC2N7I9_9HYME|nr:hypothetical protein QAD02_008841 [Eretmocerus hayati]
MSQDDDVGFLYKTMIERDPKKRRVKPVESAVEASLLDFDMGESSDDSDFRIEDHCDGSDDDSIDSNAKDDDNDDSDEDSDSSGSGDGSTKKDEPAKTIQELLEKAKQQAEKAGSMEEKLSKMLICCACLGDRSDDVNEIVECDGCGVTVHEGCYGVSDVESFSSQNSMSQSAPWFCEACSAGVEDPDCELCPNKGGIFKETDVGRWVHLVCALYVPGVAFGEVDRLTNVTLFEMPPAKWGAKACSLCEDVRFARTGVCIECDAGMCYTYFHVTCAQREGMLSEAQSGEVEQADPFYANCKLHSDKTLIRKRKQNWLTLQLRASYRVEMLKKQEYRETEEFQRIQRKLAKHRRKYLAHKAAKPPPWVPDQKVPRMLTTSASALRKLFHKAELMGVDTAALDRQEEQIASLVDMHKKWHIPPAFSVEFVSYYIDRRERLVKMKNRLDELLKDNAKLLSEQQELDKKYDEAMTLNEEQAKIKNDCVKKIELYHRVLKGLNYTKSLPNIEEMLRPKMQRATPASTSQRLSESTPESSKLQNSLASTNSHSPDTNHKASLQVRHQCGICRRSTNQHLLAKCDTCQLHYHLSCLTPPLTRMPKKTKLMGWQCSECDKESSDSDVEHVDTSAPRRLRHCKDEHTSFSTSTPTPTPTPTTPHTIVEEALVHKPPSSNRRKSTPSLSSPTRANSVNNTANNVSPVNSSSVPHAPKVTIKPLGLEPMQPEVMLVDEVNYNHHDMNNSNAPLREISPEYTLAPLDGLAQEQHFPIRSGKKRRREKHKRYSPDPITGAKQRKRKHKRKSLDSENPENHKPPEVHRRITIKIKPIPMPEGEVASETNPQLFVASSTSTEMTTTPTKQQPLPPPAVMSPYQQSLAISAHSTPLSSAPTNSNRTSSGSNRKSKDADFVSQCIVCSTLGTLQNLVMCDECKKCYHFACLDPPVKKSPKRRGYSWHCADCDPSVSMQ